MTTTITDRPLPMTLAELRQHYWPPQPESLVTECMVALRRIDELIAATREQLTQRDEMDHRIVSELIGAAIKGDPVQSIAAKMSLGDRPHLDRRFDQLQVARRLLWHKHTVAERDDPIHQEWKRECDAIVREWQIVMSAETPEDRFAGLVAFVSRH